MSKRPILIAGNWKMNHGKSEAVAFAQELGALLKAEGGALKGKQSEIELCLFPSFLTLVTLAEEAKALSGLLSLPLLVGAQNAHWEKKGAYTGEISGPMLLEFGIKTALTGHSERRQFFGETDETVRRRTESLLQQGFKVVACIGETKQERESGRTKEVLHRQLSALLSASGAIPAQLNWNPGQLVIAYEPVWAIGTGLTATPDQAEESHAVIRNFVRNSHGEEVASKLQLLYGGSVTPENASNLLSRENIDGALIGGASLKAESFFKIAQAASR